VLELEAKWFAKQVARLGARRVSPILNIGSSTRDYRATVQPWIEQHLWRPITEQGATVFHMDVKRAPGVDIVGDLGDRGFLEYLSTMRFRCVFCNNLLEHVPNRQEVCDAVRMIAQDGAHLFVSCPHSYPYHLDPLDTMFRPGIEELAALFAGTEIHQAEIIRQNAHRRPLALAWTLVRLCMPFYRPTRWAFMVRHNLSYLWKDFEATCVVLRARGGCGPTLEASEGGKAAGAKH